MDPSEYLDTIKSTVAEDVKDGVLHSKENINKLAMSAQAKILGFTMDKQYNYITDISNEFATELTEGSKKEIDILRKKYIKVQLIKLKILLI